MSALSTKTPQTKIKSAKVVLGSGEYFFALADGGLRQGVAIGVLSSSIVRAAALRSNALSFTKAFSIGRLSSSLQLRTE